MAPTKAACGSALTLICVIISGCSCGVAAPGRTAAGDFTCGDGSGGARAASFSLLAPDLATTAAAGKALTVTARLPRAGEVSAIAVSGTHVRRFAALPRGGRQLLTGHVRGVRLRVALLRAPAKARRSVSVLAYVSRRANEREVVLFVSRAVSGPALSAKARLRVALGGIRLARFAGHSMVGEQANLLGQASALLDAGVSPLGRYRQLIASLPRTLRTRVQGITRSLAALRPAGALKSKPSPTRLYRALTAVRAAYVAHTSASLNKARAAVRALVLALNRTSGSAGRRTVPTTRTVSSAADTGAGSLRAALAASGDGDTIDLSPAIPNHTVHVGGCLVVDHAVTIAAPAGQPVTLASDGSDRVLKVTGGTADAPVVLRGLHITGGRAKGDGGGLLNLGVTQVADSTITGNHAGDGDPGDRGLAIGASGGSGGDGGRGGGIANLGTLAIVRSSISDNVSGSGGAGGDVDYVKGGSGGAGGAAGDGGGIFSSGSLTITDSTVDGNAGGHGGKGGDTKSTTVDAADGDGGAGATGGIADTGTLAIAGSTVSNNIGGRGGDGGVIGGPGGAGGIEMGAGRDVSLRSSTVADNVGGAGGTSDNTGDDQGGYPGYGGVGGVTEGRGGGLGTLTMDATTLAGNQGGQYGTAYANGAFEVSRVIAISSIIDGSCNVIGEPSSSLATSYTLGVGCVLNSGNHNVQATDPGLAGLADNGGPTMTMALLPGSPAIDQGIAIAGTTLDQRGVGFPRTVGAAPDIGAFERQTGQLTVAANGSGGGTITSEPAGISCPGTCSASFPDGTTVTLTGTAASGSALTGWAGCDAGTSCVVTMSADRSATATFETLHTVSVEFQSGSGSGTVTSSPAGIDCTDPPSGSCSAQFPQGSTVVLTATAPDGHTAEWNPMECDSTSRNGYNPAECTVAVTDDRATSVHF